MQHLAVIAMCAVVALSGCKKKSNDAPATPGSSAPMPSRQEFDRTMASFLTMLTAMSDAVEKSAGDCDKATAAVDKVITDNKDVLARAKTQLKSVAANGAGDWVQAHNDKLTEVLARQVEVTKSCISHPAFKAVLAKIDAP